MAEVNGSFRQKKVKFSQVSNSALRDTELSLKAKGLYSLIQSYITLENFILYKTTLKKQCSEGSTSFESTWSELKTKGYLKQYKYRNSNGFFVYEYDLLDVKEVDEKEVDHTPKTYPMDNLSYGKGGMYNKTDLTKTYLNNTKTLHHLAETDDVYVKTYLKIMSSYQYNHKKVSDKSLSYILESISNIKEYVEIDEFEDCVIDYFEELPRDNDGDILPFLKASKRIFEIEPVECY